MLSRLFSIAVVAVLVSGGVATLSTGAAAAPSCLPNACAHSVATIPGSGGTDPGGGSGDAGGGGGNTGPGLGCPTLGGQVTCNLGGNNAPAAAPQVPTIDLVYDARDELELPAPHIHTDPAGRSYVDIRTDLSVNAGDIKDQQAQAETPGQTVTVRATRATVAWNTGEGSVSCGGITCGYTYRHSSAYRPGGRYAISVTVTWQLSWVCAGACDTPGGNLDPMGMTTSGTLAVGEIQTESRPG